MDWIPSDGRIVTLIVSVLRRYNECVCVRETEYGNGWMFAAVHGYTLVLLI